MVDNDRGGYQYKTVTKILGKKVETLLDGGAGSNHVTEELVVSILNHAASMGIKPNSPEFPVVKFEQWVYPEYVHGIASGSPVPLKGAVVLKVRLQEGPDENSCKDGHEIYVRCKIAAKGTSDWHGLILGGRALDCEARRGLRNLESQVKVISTSATSSTALRRRAGSDDDCEDTAHAYGKAVAGEYPEAKERLEVAEGLNPASGSRDSRYDAGLRAGVSAKVLKKQERSRKRATAHREVTKVNLARERLTRQAERLAREEADEEQEGAGPQRRPPPPSSYEVDEGLDELMYEWGSWICGYCSSVNPPKAYACQSYYQGEECQGTYEYNFAGWAPSKEPRQKTAKKQKMTLLEEQLLKESWTCSRCSAGNLVYRVKCFKCSLKRPEPEGDASSGSEDDYRPRRTAATEEAAEAFLRSRQDLGLRKHRKRGGTRHKKKTKKVKKRLAAGSAFRGPRAVVGGHSAFRAKRKRSSAGWPAAERASSRSRAVRPKRSKKKLRRASWARSRKSRNRSMHAMNGNSLGAKQFLAACSCLLAIPVIRETDEVIGVASEAVQDIILEGGNQIRETMTTVSMTCQVVTIWFIAMKILNWMQRCRNGNTVVTEAKLVHLDGDLRRPRTQHAERCVPHACSARVFGTRAGTQGCS